MTKPKPPAVPITKLVLVICSNRGYKDHVVKLFRHVIDEINPIQQRFRVGSTMYQWSGHEDRVRGYSRDTTHVMVFEDWMDEESRIALCHATHMGYKD